MVNAKTVSFYVHSTFRNHAGKQVKPYGLEWGMDGDSRTTFVPVPASLGEDTAELPDLNALSTHRGIVEAYNRWAFARETDYKVAQDILKVKAHVDGKHVLVEWANNNEYVPYKVTRNADVRDFLKNDPAANGGDPVEVWINGIYEGRLDGQTSIGPLLSATKRASGPGTQMAYKRCEGLIRIEKYFRGMLRKHQVFEHIMDNLIALEDPEIIGTHTLIGTATVPDWIMGGHLTSRLYIEELDNGNLKFLRPLYLDNTGTADRRFVLFNGKDDDKISIAREELNRLRFLASMKHPHAPEQKQEGGRGEPDTVETGAFVFDNLPDAVDASTLSSVVLDCDNS